MLEGSLVWGFRVEDIESSFAEGKNRESQMLLKERTRKQDYEKRTGRCEGGF